MISILAINGGEGTFRSTYLDLYKWAVDSVIMLKSVIRPK